jgi:hypothetical protein
LPDKEEVANLADVQAICKAKAKRLVKLNFLNPVNGD